MKLSSLLVPSLLCFLSLDSQADNYHIFFKGNSIALKTSKT